MLNRLHRRQREPELMDQPGLDEKLHGDALRGLQRINRISGTGGVVWTAIEKLALSAPSRTWRVLDVASGGGDVAIDVARRAAQRKIDLGVDGCDVSPFAVDYATEQAAERGIKGARFFKQDVLNGPLPGGYDVVMCSLFLHHLDEESAVALLSKMAAAARRLVLVSDLCRSRFGYMAAWMVCRVLTRSPVVHVDGPLSVQAAYSLGEIRDVAHRGGLSNAVIEPRWPYRFLLQWSPA
jgi:SAM-dependent methyltransferase